MRTSTLAALLRRLRSSIYTGLIRSIARKTGINQYFSDPYWHLVYQLSEDTQTHSIGGQQVEFQTRSFEEFLRFRELAGEKPVLQEFVESITPSDTIYDVGANVGTYTCFAASKVDSGQVIAFEPEPHNISSLRTNLDLNDFRADVYGLAPVR